MTSLKQGIKCCISTQCVTGQCYSQHTVPPNDVELAVKKLKANKSDVNPGIMSKHIIIIIITQGVYLSLRRNPSLHALHNLLSFAM